MTIKEKMQALIDGETLVCETRQLELISSGGMLVDNCHPRDLFDGAIDWQIKPKTKELSAEDIARAWNNANLDFGYVPVEKSKNCMALIKALGL